MGDIKETVTKMIDREIVMSVADKYNQLFAELVGKKMVRRTVRKLVFETI